MLRYKTGVGILHVPYRGGADSLIDLLSDNIQMMNEPMTLPHVKAGKLHLLNIKHSDAQRRLTGRPDADRARLSQCRRADLVAQSGR